MPYDHRAQLSLPLPDLRERRLEVLARTPASILVVTADPAVGIPAEAALAESGQRVTLAGDGRTALVLARGVPRPDVIVLDARLPDVPGTEVLRELRSDRATRPIPVLVVARSDMEADRIVAFELGADDVVAAPCSIRELLLRVRVQIRAATRGGTALIERAGIRLDRDAHRVWVEGGELALSVRELRLLRVLMERAERVLSRAELLQEALGTDAGVGSRSVDAYVTRLRRKLGSARDHIETVSGVGYRLRDPRTER
jgi:two-component system phosphate regulon response regulator PhoB